MRADAQRSLLAVVLMTLVLGLGYPLAVTGAAQVLFPGKSDGSTITRDGRLVGSKLIGQDFKGQRAYFQSRPSQTGYDPSITYFSNLGPNNTETRQAVAKSLRAYLKLEGRYSAELTAADVPIDAVTQSASGVDPHISEANARIQANRVAAVRGLSLERVNELIDDHTDGRFLGLLGEPGVNVLELNLSLNEEAPAR